MVLKSWISERPLWHIRIIALYESKIVGTKFEEKTYVRSVYQVSVSEVQKFKKSSWSIYCPIIVWEWQQQWQLKYQIGLLVCFVVLYCPGNVILWYWIIKSLLWGYYCGIRLWRPSAAHNWWIGLGQLGRAVPHLHLYSVIILSTKHFKIISTFDFDL